MIAEKVYLLPLLCKKLEVKINSLKARTKESSRQIRKKTTIFRLSGKIGGNWRQLGGIRVALKVAQFYCGFSPSNRIKKY